MRPEDTRCHAASDGGRCQNTITFDQESDNWLIWCDEHAEQERLARTEGGERVERVGGDLDEDLEIDSEES